MTEFGLTLSLFLGTFEDPFAFFALMGALVLGLYCIRASYSLSFFLTISLTFALTTIIKSVTKVPRPDDALIDVSGYRFPSMHAALAGAFIASLAWHLLMRTQKRAIKIAIVISSCLLTALIAYTRLYLGVHELLDVLVGALLGASVGILIHAAMRRLKLE